MKELIGLIVVIFCGVMMWINFYRSRRCKDKLINAAG